MDTGFNGHLTLSGDMVHYLDLPLVGNRRAALGDGRVVVLDVYLAQVIWHEREQEVLVLQAEGGSLLGMSLLYGSRLTVDVIGAGRVLIEELPGLEWTV